MRVKQFILERPALAIAVGVSALLGYGLLGVWLWTNSIANDFGVYWRTANNPVDLAYWAGFEYPFPYMPTMLLWIAPLKLIPLWVAYAAWFGFSAWALAAAARPHLSRNQIWLLLICPPFANGMLTGQVSVAMAAAMLWACGTSNRVAAGVAFGVVASIKPQLVVMAPLFLLLNKDWRAIGASALTFLSLIVAATLAYGPTIWASWLQALENFRAVLNETEIIRVGSTPASFAEKMGLEPLPFLALGGCLGAWLVYRCRKSVPLEAMAAIGVGSLLASPYALTYDLIVVAPFLVALIFRNRIGASVALSGILPPVPLLLAAYELWRTKDGLGRSVPETAGVEEGHAIVGGPCNVSVRNMV